MSQPFAFRGGQNVGWLMPSPSAVREIQRLVAGADSREPDPATQHALAQLEAQTKAAKRGELAR